MFDPAIPGADYIPMAINGPTQAVLNAVTVYSVVPSADPNVTSYDFLTAQLASGNLTDNANNGLSNFTLTPPPNYSVITTEPFGTGKLFQFGTFPHEFIPAIVPTK